ncbi:MAG: DeoR family transcriptional regulator [Caldilinea sp. CFX5]|nr:DeoR family transcriptional regulator [Caldilinea sp. CFX5]
MQGSRRWAYYTLQVTPPTEKQSPGLRWQGYDLNPRQQAALAFLQEHGAITTAQYVALTDVAISEQMVRRDLRTLLQLGLLRRIGQAHSTQYVLAGAE